MKRIFLTVVITIFTSTILFAQGEMDAYKLTRTQNRGTARSMGMGGAFGALGGDISGIAINPAGIGVYTKSEVVTTLDVEGTNSNVSGLNESTTATHFDNLAFVSSFDLQDDFAPRLNVGFSYNRLKDFNRRLHSGMQQSPNSLTDYMAGRANGIPAGEMGLSDGDNSPIWGNYDWLAVMGYNSRLILPPDGRYGDSYISSSRFLNNPKSGLSPSNDFVLRESGSINSYDFNMGMMFNNIVSIGFTVSMTDISYHLDSQYAENFVDGTYTGGYSLHNRLTTSGYGAQVKIGAIVKPTHAIRIGLAYQSKTWYDLSDFYSSDLDHDLSGLINDKNIYLFTAPDIDTYQPNTISSGDGTESQTDYRFITPDKWTLSFAGIISDKAIISVDYELENYSEMNLSTSDNEELPDNDYIKQDFRNASSIRAGLEFRITPRFSIRAGYSWSQNPFTTDIKLGKREVMTAGTVTHYTIDGDSQTFSGGIGYRFSHHFYADLAVVREKYFSDLYNFAGSDRLQLTTKRIQSLLTLGYQF